MNYIIGSALDAELLEVFKDAEGSFSCVIIDGTVNVYIIEENITDEKIKVIIKDEICLCLNSINNIPLFYLLLNDNTAYDLTVLFSGSKDITPRMNILLVNHDGLTLEDIRSFPLDVDMLQKIVNFSIQTKNSTMLQRHQKYIETYTDMSLENLIEDENIVIQEVK